MMPNKQTHITQAGFEQNIVVRKFGVVTARNWGPELVMYFKDGEHIATYNADKATGFWK